MTHGAASEKGLDLMAVYDGGEIGLSIGESKAWSDYPSQALSAAARKFKEVDAGQHETHVRKFVQQARYSLPMAYQVRITGAFWNQERSYQPFIAYDAAQRLDWSADREALRSLAVPVTHRIVVPLPITDFAQFFDDLADAMRAYVTSRAECTHV
jgi:hypothetical protein